MHCHLDRLGIKRSSTLDAALSCWPGTVQAAGHVLAAMTTLAQNPL
jgi:hypothetical protein